LPILSIEELIAKIDAVELPALRELSYLMLRPSRLSVAGVGPDEGAFRAAIEPLQGTDAGRESGGSGPSPLAAQAARR
jgi:hypothetical protein